MTGYFNKIYLTKPGLAWGTVCVYLFEYESKNKDYRCADMNI